MAEMKKLTRSADKKLAGVCGGIAEYFEIDPTVIRIIYAALTIFSAGFPGLLLYLILMLLMPEASKANNVEDVEFKDVKKEGK
ncbi:MAG: PspC domain-containing protein [Paludibacteraceae bacterium]|nr:PspC domain-containing protein [Paludibacteraceae bacterium]